VSLTTALPRIGNRAFRRTLLCLNGLAPPHPEDGLYDPRGMRGAEWTHGLVRRLGFLQVDSIAAVERPQYQIPFSRNPRFRREHLDRLVEQERRLFENWTHDAAILPVESFPYWRHYCKRAKEFAAHPAYRSYFALVTPQDVARVLRRVRREGPLRPRDIGGGKVHWEGDDQYFKPSIAKVAMEFLWRTGRLGVTRRNGREKVYDLVERIIPATSVQKRVSERAYLDWICTEALKRLGAASPAQIARFFDGVRTPEAEGWCRRRLGKQVVRVEVVHADGSTGGALYALAPLAETMSAMPPAPRRLRLLSPFDPLIHDRRRTWRVFGFDYTLEIWVPPKKRRYGYYVLPILEGERFTGRVDVKVDRKASALSVLGLWWEPGVKVTASREEQLERELENLSAFAGAQRVVHER